MEFAAGNAEAKARYAKSNAEYQEAVQEAEFLAERRQQEQQANRSRTQERSSSSSSSTFAHQPNRHRGVVVEKKTVKGAGGSKLEWCYIEYIEPTTGEPKLVFCKDSPLPNEGAYVMFTLAAYWLGVPEATDYIVLC